MPRYDELEHDSHEAADAATPPGLSSTTDAGTKPPAANPATRLRERAREGYGGSPGERPWMSDDNPALWVGESDWDD